MAEHVEPHDLGVLWEPNAPEAVMICAEGSAALALKAHFDDSDRRCVVLTWSHTLSACMSAPNDEAIAGHRLYGKGLSEVLWAGLVNDSSAIAEFERQNRVHTRHNPLRFQFLQHHILTLKECVVEAVSEGFSVSRSGGTTIEAATAAMHLIWQDGPG